jgi:hypothetical protein
VRYPAKENCIVSFSAKEALINNTDPFFRGWDNAFPDYYREREWEREFDRFSNNGKLPALEFVRLMHDHMGNMDVAIDGAQDGADHVDAHRSTTYVVGPYVRHHTVVPQFYTTVNLLRTIEDILGLQHLNIYTATQNPMTEVFDLDKREWSFDAIPSPFSLQHPVAAPGLHDTAGGDSEADARLRLLGGKNRRV